MSITVNIYYKGENGSARKFATPMMNTIIELRKKYDLHMKVERYISNENVKWA